MDHRAFPPEFSGPWALCYKLFSKCYIKFFDESYKKWKLYCIGLSALIHNITVWCFISKVFTENINMFEVAYMIPLCTGFIQASSKTMIMLYKKPDIENLITELASIWRTTNLNAEQMRTKKYFIKHLKFQQSIYYWGSVCGTWLHVMTPVTIVLFRRIILGEDYKLTLAFGSVYPFDPSDNWIIYLFTYSFQAFNMLNIVYGLIASEFLLITFCANLAIEFALLREDLQHVIPFIKVDDERDQALFERRSTEKYRKLSIEEFIRRHQRLIRLSVQLDDVFNGMILLNILCTTVMICFFGFASTVARGFVETVNNYEAVVAMLLQVYMFSYYGELMKDESLRVADSAYKNPWYIGDIKFQRTIVFIIARSQRACCLSAWKQVPVTLNMFAKVSSSAWSYFSIVTTVYSRHQDSNPE